MPCSHCHQSGHNITTCKLVGLQVGGGPTQRSITADEMTRVSSCVKIQRAWRAHYRPDADSCSICLSDIDKKKNCCVTECGHEFCLKCLATSLQHRQTCPLCRATLVPDVPEVNIDREIDDAYTEGVTASEQRLGVWTYERGLIDGRAITEDELESYRRLSRSAHASAVAHVVALDMAKAEITRLNSILLNLRCDHKSSTAAMCVPGCVYKKLCLRSEI
jgi:hypothetical protein